MGSSLFPYMYSDETEAVQRLLKNLPWNSDLSFRTERRATDLVRRIRAEKAPPGQLESFLQEYSLNTEEGIALMCLAEALLRIPDKHTARALIQDKVGAANWTGKKGADRKDWVVRAAGLGLLVTRKTLDSALSRMGEPVIHASMVKAMHIMSNQFVLGTDIQHAIKNASPYEKQGYRMSYDILGEGARTMADAEKYYESYSDAIRAIGARPEKPGMSVKLSALHPRYSYAQRDRSVPAITEKLIELCRLAAANDISITVDAEEVERLEISLDIIRGALRDSSLSHWEGFGFAVQAYQKRALPLLEETLEISKTYGRRLQVRLVKGAYWDSEIKRAQVQGLEDYPVYTRKENTDVSYLSCAHKMLAFKDYIYSMFGTHNAYTAAAVIEMSRDADAPFEFQRLFGMGGALYDTITREQEAKVSIYAPVGPQEDLLAYLVRRLLENGANTSFVNKVMNPHEPVENLVSDIVDHVQKSPSKRHSLIKLPKELYANEQPSGRFNSSGMDLTADEVVTSFISEMRRFEISYEAAPLIGGKIYKDTHAEAVLSPSDHGVETGRCYMGNKGLVDKSVRVSVEGFEEWSAKPSKERALVIDRFGDLLEKHCYELMTMCIREAGKTIPDALAEIREAVDFCRYYANRGRHDFSDQKMPGPTGEENVMRLVGRGAFLCVSPWNFPLAIFTGQVVAALMAGNSVIAKPAEQTPLIALLAVRLLHEAGVPKSALNLVPGDGAVGAMLVSHPDIAGVAFTGSTDVAWEINKTLAAKKGPIVPLIAETGGLNAMIVDSSALPEQVIDDVLLSAFGSAGQRCSSLRILCIQEEAADKIIRMLEGAMKEIRVGDPRYISSDIGPVIDQEALGKLIAHRENLKGFGKLIYEVPVDEELKKKGFYFGPCAFELNSLEGLDKEVFGPILHVVRYKRDQIEDLIDDINSKGYGLTLGVHSRIDEFQHMVSAHVRAGNIYVNRSIIGAVVGTQPFGGRGLSGTGPKAGGPHYLQRFATERVISTNTAAAGGNATLVSMGE